MIGARRRLLAVLLTAVLAGTVTAAAPAQAATHTRMSYSYLMDHVSTWHVGPNRHTYYGRIDFKGTWTRTSHGLKPNFTVSYHEPASPAMRAKISRLTKRPNGFCWPWEDMSKCKGWNNPESWDWKGLYNDIKPKQPWDFSDQEKCAKGEEKGALGIFGKGVVGLVLGSGKAAVRMTPQGLATALVGSCLLSVWFS